MDPRTFLAHVDAGHVWQHGDDGPTVADVGDIQLDVTAECRGAWRAGLVALGQPSQGGRRWGLTSEGVRELARLAANQPAAEPDGPADAGVLYLAVAFGVVTSSRPDGPLAPVLEMLHRRATAAVGAHTEGDRHDDVVEELLGVVFRLRDGEGEAA